MRKVIFDREQLRRELFDRSALLIRSAHALELAAEQLREAPRRDSWSAVSVDIHSAAMTAMHGALGALALSGEYQMAALIDEMTLTDG